MIEFKRLGGALSFALCLMAGLILLPAASARAQTVEQTEFELRQVGTWSQSLTEFNTRSIALMETSEHLIGMLDGYADGVKSATAVQEEVRAWRVQYDARIAAMREEFAALPPPPRLRALSSLQPGLEAVTRRSEQNIDQVAAFGVQMSELIDRVTRGEVDAAAALHERAIRMVRELVVFENGSLAIMQALSPPEHPNQNMAASRIAFNNGLVVFFDAYLRSASADAASVTSEQRSLMRQASADMRRHNRDGRDAVRSQQLAAAVYAQTLTPAMRAGVDRVFASLLESFGTLDQAAALVESAASIADGAKIEEMDAILETVGVISDALERENMERASALGGVPAPAL